MATEPDKDLHRILEEWQDAMRKRDALREIRDRLRAIPEAQQLQSLRELEELLAKAEQDLAEIQKQLLGR